MSSNKCIDKVGRDREIELKEQANKAVQDSAKKIIDKWPVWKKVYAAALSNKKR